MNQGKENLARNEERLLIAKVKAGDPAAMRELVDGHKDRLFAFIWRMVRNHHDSEEICQEAFLKAFASLDSFSSEYRFSTWLFTIGYRVCLNQLRRKRQTPRDVDVTLIPFPTERDEPDFVESEEAGRLRDAVWAAVEKLTPPQRAAVLLFYRQGLDCREVARVLEVPLATVKSHLHRARLRLSELLENVSEKDLGGYRNLAGGAG